MFDKNSANFGEGSQIEIADTLFMVSTGASSPDTMASQIGIAVGEDNPNGIVLEIPSTVAGVLPSSAVDWFTNARNA